MQPTILYIHDPASDLAPEALRELGAVLSAEEDRAWRLERCRARRRGDDSTNARPVPSPGWRVFPAGHASAESPSSPKMAASSHCSALS